MTWEMPAGMLHANGDCRGTAFDEIREETGLVFDRGQLIHLTVAPFSSPGLLDERYTFYSVECPGLREKTRAIDPSRLGAPSEGELIASVRTVRVTDANHCNDAKLLAALAAWNPSA